ncbi:uncharacterized protein K452DRAFT_329726 [Aplosporella prunicola CBS 121167]|uniref:CNNM transmembrane domain-containing protein n=1 Tax=Aplosporella prunicola CBS 121167 TaxID=1176127 RepID=A0A6A6AWT1_9PEZI|nr:uncharacterized protein K452DRAFT_329726 [Aplosporella prunicola CBS 121167]KAF2136409.1 hypothetical protein K452DRAFT_329726 [Aplosporella prunicola CBS 121167]
MSLVAARALASGPFASHHHGLASARPLVLVVASLLFSAVASAAPLPLHSLEEELPKKPKDPQLWAYLGTAIALVLLGGVFAGLTIALMGQDEIYLQVIATSGEGAERKSAARVLNLLKKGKHWVLVTLLLSNVITNETLPIVLDRSLGGGWPAVLGSTVLIVIFGEIVPQSICVRYGLPIGAWMAPLVLALMWLMAPVAWPTAKLLDYLLGEDHGTTYKKAGLKTLVTLHKTLGTSPEDRLNEDEVTIISAVLDLKDKPVGSIMTPMNDVFTMSADTVLNERTMDTILSAGYSRIPIYEPDNPRNFVGMLLVKLLITYDPEDSKQVREFALATLPETRPETSCLDIVNFFQEGKSHMVLVSDFPGESYGALGVVTLEDVIEELIGEEIIDESDVFIDVHKAIRRIAPAPRNRVPKGEIVESEVDDDATETTGLLEGERRQRATDGTPSRNTSVGRMSSSPNVKLLMRRRSSGNGSLNKTTALDLRENTSELREHLKHLGPSNAASRPKTTRISTVKIKPSVGTIPETSQPKPQSAEHIPKLGPTAMQGGIGEGLLHNAAGDASDGAHAVAIGYGSIGGSSSPNKDIEHPTEAEQQDADGHRTPTNDNYGSPATQRKIVIGAQQGSPRSQRSSSTVASLRSASGSGSPKPRKSKARSGSISENVIDVNGVKKIVLEANSSSDDADPERQQQREAEQPSASASGDASAEASITPSGEDADITTEDVTPGNTLKKKKRKKRAGKKAKERQERRQSESLL